MSVLFAYSASRAIGGLRPVPVLRKAIQVPCSFRLPSAYPALRGLSMRWTMPTSRLLRGFRTSVAAFMVRSRSSLNDGRRIVIRRRRPTGSSGYNDPRQYVLGVIVLNGLVYTMWSTVDHRIMVENFLLSNAHIRAGKIHTLITHFFSHVSFFHLLSNMVGLWFLKDFMGAMGGGRFLRLYFTGGIVSGIAHLLYVSYVNRFQVPAGFNVFRDQPALGASGAVMSVLVPVIAANPRQMLYLYGVLPVPAYVFALLFGAWTLCGMYRGNDNVGHAAHLAGAVTGGIYFLLFRRKLPF